MRTKLPFLLFMIIALSAGFVNGQMGNVVWDYQFPTDDSVLVGLADIRALTYDADLLGDGVSAIAVTNYEEKYKAPNGGRVHVFKTIGDNELELVWSSPTPDSLGGGSTPRFVVFGDMDGDGRKEVIYHNRWNGIYIYEWDGVAGSYNFGTKPSQIISKDYIKIAVGVGSEWVEHLEVNDYDNDGRQELAVAYNSGTSEADNYYVISAIGNWSTDSPGFSGFTVEFELNRLVPNLGLGGSPVAMIGADIDGDGDKDIIGTDWNFKNVFPITTVQADSFALPDTVSGMGHLEITRPADDLALFGGLAADIDNDGREEVYLPTYGENYGKLDMLHWEGNQPTNQIDTTNIFVIDISSKISGSALGYGIGDFDGDNKPNIYISSIVGFGEAVITAEFQGGEKTDLNNWTVDLVYEGVPGVVKELVVEIDTAGNVIDTIKVTPSSQFVANMYANYTDFDKDGFEDILIPFQVVPDSIAWGAKRWISETEYVQEIKNIENPNRQSIVILENSPSGFVSRDLTIITPDDYELRQNYPNPFNPETKIEFFLPVRKKISLTVYNSIGQKVKTLINDEQYDSGSFEISWDGTNEAGYRVASGMYIYTLKYGNFSKSKRMMFLK